MMKKLAFIAALAIAVCISFFITKYLIGNIRHNDNDVIIPKNTDIIDDDSTSINEKEEIELVNPDTIHSSITDNPRIILKATRPTEDNNRYSFKASFEGDLAGPYHYELWSNKLIQSSNDGHFNNIPPISGGKYKLRLVSEATGNNLVTSISVGGFVDPNEPNPNQSSRMRITKEDFQRRMLDKTDRSLDGGRKSFVTKNFRVVVSNPDPSESAFGVSDIQDVRDMIRTYSKWKGATVVDLTYDANGNVEVATIEAIR